MQKCCFLLYPGDPCELPCWWLWPCWRAPELSRCYFFLSALHHRCSLPLPKPCCLSEPINSYLSTDYFTLHLITIISTFLCYPCHVFVGTVCICVFFLNWQIKSINKPVFTSRGFFYVTYTGWGPVKCVVLQGLAQGHMDRLFTLLAQVFEPVQWLAQLSNC